MARSPTVFLQPQPFFADDHHLNKSWHFSRSSLPWPQTGNNQQIVERRTANALTNVVRTSNASPALRPSNPLYPSHRRLPRRHTKILVFLTVIFEISLVQVTIAIVLGAVHAKKDGKDPGAKEAVVILGVCGAVGMAGTTLWAWLIWQGRRERERLERLWKEEDSISRGSLLKQGSRKKDATSVAAKESQIFGQRRSRSQHGNSSPGRGRSLMRVGEDEEPRRIPSFQAMTVKSTTTRQGTTYMPVAPDNEEKDVADEDKSNWTHRLDLDDSSSSAPSIPKLPDPQAGWEGQKETNLQLKTILVEEEDGIPLQPLTPYSTVVHPSPRMHTPHDSMPVASDVPDLPTLFNPQQQLDRSISRLSRSRSTAARDDYQAEVPRETTIEGPKIGDLMDIHPLHRPSSPDLGEQQPTFWDSRGTSRPIFPTQLNVLQRAAQIPRDRNLSLSHLDTSATLQKENPSSQQSAPDPTIHPPMPSRSTLRREFPRSPYASLRPELDTKDKRHSPSLIDDSPTLPSWSESSRQPLLRRRSTYPPPSTNNSTPALPTIPDTSPSLQPTTGLTNDNADDASTHRPNSRDTLEYLTPLSPPPNPNTADRPSACNASTNFSHPTDPSVIHTPVRSRSHSLHRHSSLPLRQAISPTTSPLPPNPGPWGLPTSPHPSRSGSPIESHFSARTVHSPKHSIPRPHVRSISSLSIYDKPLPPTPAVTSPRTLPTTRGGASPSKSKTTARSFQWPSRKPAPTSGNRGRESNRSDDAYMANILEAAAVSHIQILNIT